MATYFLEKFAKKSNRNLTGFSKKAIGSMMAYNWPGNVRELEHLIERQVVMATGAIIKEIQIPNDANKITSKSVNMVKTISENERDHIFTVLELCNGKISGTNGAAKMLGVPATTLNSKIKKLGFAKKHVF
ncbi:AAA-type ATPase lid domain-containing protein [Pedobacter jamesrossensis]|uniref:Sigma-54 factor interaction domain-containing protein n=1 Tax=Pedobacter jamesrossensis TaxID=1908238 RepID=A0ABV8NJH8_9SPHI